MALISTTPSAIPFTLKLQLDCDGSDERVQAVVVLTVAVDVSLL